MEEEGKRYQPRKSKLGWSLIPIAGVIIALIILALRYSDLDITGLSVFNPEGGYVPRKLDSYTFEDVYNEIKKIDQVYETDYHEEGLVKNRIAAEYLPLIIADLTRLYDAINASKHRELTKYLLGFVEARMGWLEAQTYLEKALRFGRKGIVTTDFECADNETVLLATYYYNQTLKHYHKATIRLDNVLFYVPEAKEKVGMNDNKPKIYTSLEAGEIAKAINTNIHIIDKYCRKLPELQQDEEDIELIKIVRVQ